MYLPKHWYIFFNTQHYINENTLHTLIAHLTTTHEKTRERRQKKPKTTQGMAEVTTSYIINQNIQFFFIILYIFSRDPVNHRVTSSEFLLNFRDNFACFRNAIFRSEPDNYLINLKLFPNNDTIEFQMDDLTNDLRVIEPRNYQERNSEPMSWLSYSVSNPKLGETYCAVMYTDNRRYHIIAVAKHKQLLMHIIQSFRVTTYRRNQCMMIKYPKTIILCGSKPVSYPYISRILNGSFTYPTSTLSSPTL